MPLLSALVFAYTGIFNSSEEHIAFWTILIADVPSYYIFAGLGIWIYEGLNYRIN